MRSFLTRHWLPLLLLAVVLTRFPYLSAGYGSDADAWLVASSGWMLWHAGEYVPSRLPGYPLHEIALSVIVPFGGSLLSNTFTLLFTLAAIVIWSRIAQRHSPHPRLLTLTLAFAPVVWQHSADTMDYLWSLCFALAAFSLADQRKIALSAIACGIAIGFRLANAVFALPLMVFLLLKKQTVKEMLLFSSLCILVSVAAYSPLLTKYGISGWMEVTRTQMSDVHPESFILRAAAFGYRIVYSIGPVAMVLAAAFLFTGRQQLLHSVRTKEPMTVFSIAIIVVYLMLFWAMPLERAYLLPAMPFLFLLVSRVCSTRQFALWMSILILSGLVTIDVVDRDQRRQARFNIHEGMVIQEYLYRTERVRDRLRISSLSFDHKAVVMTSDLSFWFENDLVDTAPNPGFVDTQYEKLPEYEGHRKLVRKVNDPDVLFITYLYRHEAESARASGYTLYCPRRVRELIEKRAGYSLDEVGVRIIDLAD